jgi:DUF4097 and DUF4098 domain-containing protein YvlB
MFDRPSGRMLARIPLVVFCLVLPGRGYAQDCEASADRSATGSLSGVDRVHVIAGAGSLEVTGRAGATALSARGRACVSERNELEDVRLEVRREGSTLVLEAKYPDEHHVQLGNYYARLDLEVNVPEGTAVYIEDGSGNLTFSGTGATRVDDGSGEMRGSDIRGALVIVDGSGNIDLRGVAGAIEIEDGSGEIEIEQARGAVEIEDGSGEIRVRNAESVRVSDGSGDIRLADVNGNVVVDEDGSGSIRVEGVGGNFTVDDDGSGSVSYRNVSGRVSVPDDD